MLIMDSHRSKLQLKKINLLRRCTATPTMTIIMNCEQTTATMHFNQTSHNMEGGAQPKENGNEWCMKKNEQMKKKLIRVALEFFKKCWV